MLYYMHTRENFLAYYKFNISDTRKSFIRWDAPNSTNQSVKKKKSNNLTFNGGGHSTQSGVGIAKNPAIDSKNLGNCSDINP